MPKSAISRLVLVSRPIRCEVTRPWESVKRLPSRFLTSARNWWISMLASIAKDVPLGVVLTPILKREQTRLKAFKGTSFAIDASIEIHQFLALVRKRDGSLFTDSQGRVTSHLIGLFTRTSRLIADFDMKPVFVFDGKPNPMKRRTIEMRREARKKAEVEYVEAVSKKDYAKAWSKAVMTGGVTGSILDDSKRLLTLMGIPCIEALEDAEAQASYMAARGEVWPGGSKAYDCLLYGAPILARYLTLTGRERLTAQQRL